MGCCLANEPLNLTGDAIILLVLRQTVLHPSGLHSIICPVAVEQQLTARWHLHCIDWSCESPEAVQCVSDEASIQSLSRPGLIRPQTMVPCNSAKTFAQRVRKAGSAGLQQVSH